MAKPRLAWDLFVAVLTPVVVVALAFLGYRQLGIDAYETAKAEWLARGEPSHISDLALPPLLPDQSYFCQNPLLQAQLRFRSLAGGAPGQALYEDEGQQRILGSLDFPEPLLQSFGRINPPTRTDFAAIATTYSLPEPSIDPVAKISRLLSANDAIFRSLIESARLPAGHFGMIWDVTDLADAPTPHYFVWTKLTKLCTLRARVALAQRESRSAFEELTVPFRLTETLEADPVILASMIRLTMQMMAIPPIWEGLESRSWASTELLALEQELAKWKPIEDQIRCYRGDCALGLNLPDRRITEEEWAIRESMTGPIPRWPFQIPGVAYFNAANYFRASYRACYLPLLSHDWKSVSRERLYIDGIPEYDLHSILHRKELPIFLLVTERCVTLAIHVILARTAIALERYHLDRGSYPSELAALVPDYLSTLPTDLMDGAPLRYIPIENGRFKVYSIGWDFRDQKGKIKDQRTGRLADQVWTYDLADGDEPQPGLAP